MIVLGFAAASAAISIAVYGPGEVAKNVVGVLVGILKMPAVTIPAIVKGRAPPNFSAGSTLGVKLMGEDGFRDVFFGSADGTQLHAVQDDGSRRVVGKRPIVFVHGFPELWVSWRSQLSKFAAAGHPVLALSMRGYGLSDKPSEVAAFDMVLLTQDIRAAVSSSLRRIFALLATADHVNSIALCVHQVQYSERSVADASSHVGQEGVASSISTAVKPLLVAHDWGAGVCWPFVSHAGGEEMVCMHCKVACLMSCLGQHCRPWSLS
jgi:pimeloyl-ACP methyl ester carboxylesterase